MAKKPSKTPAKATAKKASVAPKSKTISVSIEKACEEALKKLKALGLDPGLQADIEWCLGSYKADKNPAGLYEMAENALKVFTAEKEKKTKGVTAKLTGDLEKSIEEPVRDDGESFYTTHEYTLRYLSQELSMEGNLYHVRNI